ncbi:GNAT family N-acetyltransferase [Ferrimonas balearica]|uniref:GNAT family N-acetyltransferase n=1 Tax=Ferrimonas balearica TaxID=44012 RepID=UPI001C99C408|nr:GNAT family N-acetyltransferase [Ferrimonas balearica]MBY5922264.1 GNAT family N-acetyltransferase [Ferrimonas balearica]MBY5994396.1 GNAT family N-acetyltransferase [Ferrimonas balearica]
MSEALRAEFVPTITTIDPMVWDALLGAHLFTRYHYLEALERSGCVGLESGWIPQHLLLYRDDRAIAAMPLYIKLHSYGEYLFDWSWARAFEQHGQPYYPKLVSAIPFTAVSGPRLGIAPKECHATLHAAVAHALQQRAEGLGGSGAQVLFVEGDALSNWALQDWYRRRDLRYQWHHRGESDFDAFLARFKSRKRKMVHKERARIVDAGIHIDVLNGGEISPAHWHTFLHCYRNTYLKRSGHGGYLTPEFFQRLADAFSEHLVMMVARQHGHIIACALYMKQDDTLYGRYWGALQPMDGLHFELCYYQGIEYCLRHGLKRFDPGVQGEHKLARGFEPVYSYGVGTLQNTLFADAIHHFCQEEWGAVGEALEQAKSGLPFRSEGSNSN